jgi:hypothetical protein
MKVTIWIEGVLITIEPDFIEIKPDTANSYPEAPSFTHDQWRQINEIVRVVRGYAA